MREWDASLGTMAEPFPRRPLYWLDQHHLVAHFIPFSGLTAKDPISRPFSTGFSFPGHIPIIGLGEEGVYTMTIYLNTVDLHIYMVSVTPTGDATILQVKQLTEEQRAKLRSSLYL